MEIKSEEVVFLKKKLNGLGIKGLALDIDETLSFTIGSMIQRLIDRLGNPENLTVWEIARKYRHTDNIPYWQGPEAMNILNEFNKSNSAFENLSLIENSYEMVQKINKIIPVVAYITVRSSEIIEATKFWLKNNNFPDAPVIAKPMDIHRKDGNEWKAKVLEYLYPQVVGIVDDNPGLTKFFSSKYKGVIYLYDNTETKRKDINVVPCENWKVVAEKIKECKI